MGSFDPRNCRQLEKEVKGALESWSDITSSDDLLEQLLIVRQERRAKDVEHKPTRWRLATNSVLEKALDKLSIESQDLAQVLRLRFLQNNTIAMVANQMNVAEITVSRNQKDGIERLTKILCLQEKESREQRVAEIQARFEPSSYSKLFGIVEVREQLLEQVQAVEAPWVIAIVGLGGIGKTSLADDIVREVTPELRYEDIVWLRAGTAHLSGRAAAPQMTYEALITDLAKVFWPDAGDKHFQERLVQVRQRLNEQPHLIIIDNLERQADTAYLLAHLNELATPSKFMLTTRSWPAAQAGIYNLSLEELSFNDGMALMIHYGQEIGIKAIDEANESDFHNVYKIVGGNPHALKLVTSLLDVMPFYELLNALQRGSRGQGIDRMYKHIYWQSWQTLSDNGRQLLRVMPLVAEYGGDAEYLQTISGLSGDAFWPALQELRSRSLIEARGGLHEKMYGVHRLTETFLRTEIIKWDDEPDEDGQDGSDDPPSDTEDESNEEK